MLKLLIICKYLLLLLLIYFPFLIVIILLENGKIEPEVINTLKSGFPITLAIYIFIAISTDILKENKQ